MPNASSGAAHPDVTAIAGPVLIGYLLNWGLYGALSVQLFWYYLAFPKDGWAPKALVAFVYAMETAQTLIMTNDCFNAYVRNFGNPAILNAMQNEWLAVPVFTAIISCTVQLFYAYRLHILSRKKYIVVCVAALAITQMVAGIITGVKSHQIGNFSGLEAHLRVPEPIWMAGSFICDLIIAGSMAYLLLRKDPASHQTSILINRIVRLVIETGTLTALVAALDTILYFASPGVPYHVASATILAKLYSNSLLVIFNSRIRMPRGEGEEKLHISLRPRGSNMDTGSGSGGIRVREEVYVCADGESVQESVGKKGSLGEGRV